MSQVASWGAYLLSRNILAVSFAPRDTHVSQVQFALERGVPALIGIIASIRLPYPSRSFDMAHCSRCLIPWGQYGNPNCRHALTSRLFYDALWFDFWELSEQMVNTWLRLIEFYVPAGNGFYLGHQLTGKLIGKVGIEHVKILERSNLRLRR
jgi:hypothetical protein